MIITLNIYIHYTAFKCICITVWKKMLVNMSMALINIRCQLTEDDVWDSNAVRISCAEPSSFYYFHKREAISWLSVCLNAGIEG
jgi:hypothetical protein